MGDASTRGWGPGWPTNRAKDMQWVKAPSGARWLMNEGVAPLWQAAVNEVEAGGFLFDHGPTDTDDDWGYANRPIRGTQRPSNHSWGLGADVDAQNYPMGQIAKRPPQWVVDVFAKYGFSWGGEYVGRKDPMHFEYLGNAASAAARVAALRGSKPAPLPPAPGPAAWTLPLDPILMEDEMIAFVKNPTPGKQAEIWWTNFGVKRWVSHGDTVKAAGVVSTFQGTPAKTIGAEGAISITLAAFNEIPTVGPTP